MMNFVSRDILFALVFALLGSSVGWIVKEQFFTKPCPACICPECPPSNVTNLIINNEKLKVKGNGSLDLTNILKDNKVVQVADSSLSEAETQQKKKGFLGRIFGKK
jgi:molybdopterin/thiamine biosynthesis adenylyltransferase